MLFSLSWLAISELNVQYRYLAYQFWLHPYPSQLESKELLCVWLHSSFLLLLPHSRKLPVVFSPIYVILTEMHADEINARLSSYKWQLIYASLLWEKMGDGRKQKQLILSCVTPIFQSQLKLLPGTMEYTHNPTIARLHSTKTAQ